MQPSPLRAAVARAFGVAAVLVLGALLMHDAVATEDPEHVVSPASGPSADLARERQPDEFCPPARVR